MHAPVGRGQPPRKHSFILGWRVCFPPGIPGLAPGDTVGSTRGYQWETAGTTPGWMNACSRRSRPNPRESIYSSSDGESGFPLVSPWTRDRTLDQRQGPWTRARGPGPEIGPLDQRPASGPTKGLSHQKQSTRDKPLDRTRA